LLLPKNTWRNNRSKANNDYCGMPVLKWFATGGIGGVHRGGTANVLMSFSRFLQELSKNAVCSCVCWGEIFLDLALTLNI